MLSFVSSHKKYILHRFRVKVNWSLGNSTVDYQSEEMQIINKQSHEYSLKELVQHASFPILEYALTNGLLQTGEN